MGLFSRKSTPPQQPAQTSAPIALPAARQVGSKEEAGQLLEQVGDIQRQIMDGASVQGAGEALSCRIEGAALYYLGAGAEPSVVFDQIIAPISEWGMGRLMDRWVMDPNSAEGVAGKHAFDVICALREKYQHLNPANN